MARAYTKADRIPSYFLYAITLPGGLEDAKKLQRSEYGEPERRCLEEDVPRHLEVAETQNLRIPDYHNTLCQSWFSSSAWEDRFLRSSSCSWVQWSCSTTICFLTRPDNVGRSDVFVNLNFVCRESNLKERICAQFCCGWAHFFTKWIDAESTAVMHYWRTARITCNSANATI